ncbi:restriction endonuclease [Nocardia sp. NPDC049149]|uniref:restriction endonuclease n=1 Tax=Nocardia sp. NPDC049149 TaxID=3364315 RepID=UPI00371E9755
MAGAAAFAVVPGIARFVEAHTAALVVAAVCVAVAGVGAVALAVRHRRVVRTRDDAHVLSALRQNALSPLEFEQALAALCRRDGCTQVQMVGGSGDLGADVIARAPDGRRIVLQAKRYRHARSVGSQDVQRFGGTARTIHGADVAAVVTTAHTFTPHARAYADKAGILLMAAKALAAWDSRTGPAPWD